MMGIRRERYVLFTSGWYNNQQYCKPENITKRTKLKNANFTLHSNVKNF